MSGMQSLESRTLFAADPAFELTSKGTLIVHGTNTADEIVVQFKHGKASDGVQVFFTPNKDKAISVRQEFDSSFGKIKRYRIEGGDGDDFINISGGSQMTRPATILGGAGNDLISFSEFGPTLVDAGAGNDQVIGTTLVSNDSTKNSKVLDETFAQENQTAVATILGGDGDDQLHGDTNDQVDGGAGNDTASLTISGKQVSDERANALAHDYYARLGVLGIEVTKGSQPNFNIIQTIG